MTQRRLTDEEVVTLLRGDSKLNMARKQFSSWSGKIDQAGMQRTPLAPIEWRRMEFEAVVAIAAALGVQIQAWSLEEEVAHA